MARKRIQKAVSAVDQPESFKLASIGYSGVDLAAGVTTAEMHKALNFPASIKTYKSMTYHPAVAAPLSLYDYLAGQASYSVKPPPNPTEEDLFRTKFIEECLNDYQGDIKGTLSDAFTANIYGFSVLEKVYRRRLPARGSKYSDGLIGWKKLAIRNQESISKFIYDDEEDEVIGVRQSISKSNAGVSGGKSLVTLPREKFMLFTAGRARGNPYGVSPLRDVWLAWRYLTAIEELEAAGVAKDLQGIPVMRIPAQYMSADASTEQKALYETFKNIVRNLQQNTQSGVLLPSEVDDTTKAQLFSLELLSNNGQKNYDTGAVKEYYQNLIYTGLFADILKMGSGKSGSYALGTLKNSLLGSAMESMMNRALAVINDDLIVQTYKLNGWDTSRTCRIDVDDLQKIDLDSYSKAIQRFASTGIFPVTNATINSILNALDMDQLPEGQDLAEVLTDFTSRASDGMVTAGEGTSTSVSGEDTSSSNLDNAA